MTNKHFLLLLTMSFSVLGNAQNTTANPDNMTLVWSDEFNYTGAPDSTRWQYEYGFVRNEELQWYQPQNAYVRDGMLTIVAREEHFANPTFNPQSNYWGCKRDSVHCTSACVIVGLGQCHHGCFLLSYMPHGSMIA